ncbi:hypothetical protein ACIRP3_41880 [Streptomyces sp. NPDC101209]|uniref:hypothetical protein n=1 Tax=Streptomyces sp. NPDC101209 TaxID=3366129 RepID=UPI0038261580
MLAGRLRRREEAIWWWQYAAGAGNLTAAYCLSLLYLSRGELRDAEHWMRQFLAPDSRSAFVPPPSWPHSLPDSHLVHFKDAVRCSKAVEVDGIRLHHPDRRFFEQITDHLPPTDSPRSDALPRQSPVLFPPRRRWW